MELGLQAKRSIHIESRKTLGSPLSQLLAPQIHELWEAAIHRKVLGQYGKHKPTQRL